MKKENTVLTKTLLVIAQDRQRLGVQTKEAKPVNHDKVKSNVIIPITDLIRRLCI